MAAFTKEARQKIIDNYLAESGANMFVPGVFIDWLADRPDHEAYGLFFSKDDAAAAREYRIMMARQMANGLRIVARISEPERSNVVSVNVREFPAFISPMDGRRAGGGYEPFNPQDSAQMDELRRQGTIAMRSWLARYRGAFEEVGADLAPLEEIAQIDTLRVASA